MSVLNVPQDIVMRIFIGDIRQALGDLEDSFNSLESGSKSMVDQVSFP